MTSKIIMISLYLVSGWMYQAQASDFNQQIIKTYFVDNKKTDAIKKLRIKLNHSYSTYRGDKNISDYYELLMLAQVLQSEIKNPEIQGLLDKAHAVLPNFPVLPVMRAVFGDLESLVTWERLTELLEVEYTTPGALYQSRYGTAVHVKLCQYYFDQQFSEDFLGCLEKLKPKIAGDSDLQRQIRRQEFDFYISQGDFSRAEKFVPAKIDVDASPDAVQKALFGVRLLIAKGQYPEASALVKKLSGFVPENDQEFLYTKALLEILQGNFPLAKKLIDTIAEGVKEPEKNIRLQYFYIILNLRQNKTAEVISRVDKVEKLLTMRPGISKLLYWTIKQSFNGNSEEQTTKLKKTILQYQSTKRVLSEKARTALQVYFCLVEKCEASVIQRLKSELAEMAKTEVFLNFLMSRL